MSDAKRTEFIEKFHKVVKAYEILSDENLRREYDTKKRGDNLLWQQAGAVSMADLNLNCTL